MIAITKRLLLLSPLALLARRAVAETAPAAPPLAADALAAVTERAITGSMLPAYQGLAAATAALVAATREAASSAPADPPPAVKAAFAATVAAFAKVDFLRFGPMADQGRIDRFSYYPDRHGTGARQLRAMLAKADEALLVPGAIAKLSAAVQGLPAYESLLFGSDSGSETHDYRWKLASVIAANLDDIARDTLEGWTKAGGWADIMRMPGGRNVVYRDAEEPVIEILKSITTGLLQMRDQRLLPAIGDGFAAAKPNRAAFALSDNALAYLKASGTGLEQFAAASDLFSLVPSAAPRLSAASAKGFAAYRDGLAASPTWQAAFADPAAYQHLRDAFDALKGLEDLYGYRFPAEAGISPGFNALDGD